MKDYLQYSQYILIVAVFCFQSIILFQFQEAKKIKSREYIWSEVNGRCYELVNDTLFLNSRLPKEDCK